MTFHRFRRALCFAAAACATLSGCAVTTSGHPPTGPTAFPSSGSSSGRSANTTPNDPGTRLEAAALRASDLGTGLTRKLLPGGAAVSGEVTLDNCGYDFTTERFRVARRQYDLLDGSVSTGLSNELVAYDNVAHARQAARQWHASAVHCPRTPVHSHVSGEPDLTITVRRNDADVAALPARPNALTVEKARTPGGATLFLVVVLQVHMRYLDAVYFNSAAAPTASLITGVERLAAITGRRLTRLS